MTGTLHVSIKKARDSKREQNNNREMKPFQSSEDVRVQKIQFTTGTVFSKTLIGRIIPWRTCFIKSFEKLKFRSFFI